MKLDNPDGIIKAMRLQAKISPNVRKLLSRPGGNTALLEAINRVRRPGTEGPITVQIDNREFRVVQVDGDATALNGGASSKDRKE